MGKLFRRIEKEMRKYPFSKKLKRAILREVKEDLVLPMLSLRSNTKIRFEILEEDVLLIIGRRDFQFDPVTAECIGAGTFLG